MAEDTFDECRKCIYYNENGCNRKKEHTLNKRCFHYVDRDEAKNVQKELDKLVDSMARQLIKSRGNNIDEHSVG